MATPLTRDVKFSSDDQANKTMILDLGNGADTKPARTNDAEATVVLDLSATQVHTLLESAKS